MGLETISRRPGGLGRHDRLLRPAAADSNAQSRQAVTPPLGLTPTMTLQIDTVMCGEAATQVWASQGFSGTCPASRTRPLVCAETRPSSTSQSSDNRKAGVTQPSRHINPAQCRHAGDERRKIQASGLDCPAEWPRSHVAVVTEGCVSVVCETGTQRLAPVMTLQIN